MDADADYYLLLIDLKESTRLAADLAEPVLSDLGELLERLNREITPPPVIGLSVSYGDEVAGLFDTPMHLFRIVDAVRASLHPTVRVRFVAARGRIGRPSPDIRQVGGAVFKTADQAMRRIKRRRRFCRWLLGDDALNLTLDSLTEMSNALLEGMTDYQRAVFGLRAEGLSQKEIATRLQKHPQSVSDAVRRGQTQLVIEAHGIIRRLLVPPDSTKNDGFRGVHRE